MTTSATAGKGEHAEGAGVVGEPRQDAGRAPSRPVRLVRDLDPRQEKRGGGPCHHPSREQQEGTRGAGILPDQPDQEGANETAGPRGSGQAAGIDGTALQDPTEKRLGADPVGGLGEPGDHLQEDGGPDERERREQGETRRRDRRERKDHLLRRRAVQQRAAVDRERHDEELPAGDDQADQQRRRGELQRPQRHHHRRHRHDVAVAEGERVDRRLHPPRNRRPVGFRHAGRRISRTGGSGRSPSRRRGSCNRAIPGACSRARPCACRVRTPPPTAGPPRRRPAPR